MHTDRVKDLEDALYLAIEALEGFMGASACADDNETIQYLLRVLNDDGDHSVED